MNATEPNADGNQSGNSPPTTFLDWALAYAAQGRAVHPLVPNGKQPLTKSGVLDASKDPAVIRAWWAKWPDANIGMATGAPSGVTVLDCDIKPWKNKRGDITLAALEDANGALPATVTQQTWSKGWQYLFQYVPGLKNSASSKKLGKDLDIRGEGGYIVVPPSIVAEDGQPEGEYQWALYAELGVAELAPMPSWIVERLAVPEGVSPNVPGWVGELLRDGSPDGQRNQDGMKLAGYFVSKSLDADVIAAILRDWGVKSQCDPATLDADIAGWIERARELEAKKDTEWPEPQPLPDVLLPVPAFDVDALMPKAFAGWVLDAATRAQCPPEYIGVAVMTSLSSVLGRQCAIRPRRKDSWTVVPNVWGAIVGRPGVKKSPAMNEGLVPIRALARDAAEAFRASKAQRAFDERVREARKKKLEREIDAAATGKGENVLETLQAEYVRVQGIVTVPERRYFTNDATVEKIAMLHEENPIGFLVARDEMTGWLNYMDRDGHENDRSFYNEGWSGDGEYYVDRVGRESLALRGMCLSILGGIQPGPLKEYLREIYSDGMTDDGLMQRFQLLVWPDTSGDVEDVDEYPDSDARTAAVEIFRALATVNVEALGAAQGDGVPYLRFDDEAQTIFSRWRVSFDRSRVRGSADAPVLVSHFSKYGSLIASLALICHLVDVASGEATPGPVTVTALRRALDWAVYLEAHARRCYQSITDKASAAALLLAKRIEDGDLTEKFRLRELYQNDWAGLSRKHGEAVEAGIKILCKLNWLRPVKGHKGKDYHVNPKAQS